MTTNTEAIRKILEKSVFDLNTEALGWVKCRSISPRIILDKAFREQLEDTEIDGPTLVRRLLGQICLRIEEGEVGNDDGSIGRPLCESDVSQLADSEIEAFSQKICTHNSWLFGDHEKNRNDVIRGMSNSDRLVHALRENVAYLEAQAEELMKRFRKTELPLRRVGLSLSELQKHLNQINQSSKLLGDFHLQVESTIKPLRNFTEQISGSVLASKRMAEIVKANQHWQHLIDQATASSRMIADLNRAHQTWAQNYQSVQDQAAALQVAAKLSVGRIAYVSTVSERIYSRVDISAISKMVELSGNSIFRLRALSDNLTARYRKLAESLPTYQDITHLPKFVLPSATREVFIANYAVDALTVYDGGEIDQDSAELELIETTIEETSNCAALLKAVDPQLATMYAGARDAIRGDNPERGRHLLVSLRELLSHLIRKIAPDERVLEWIPQGSDNLLHEGKPTRKARLHYLCREIEHGPMDDFVISDTNATVKFMGILNRIHQPEVKLTDMQLQALLHRTEAFVTFVVQIWRESR